VGDLGVLDDVRPVLQDPAPSLAVRRQRVAQQLGGVLEREHPAVSEAVDELAVGGRWAAGPAGS
jgi:hypothetical protein